MAVGRRPARGAPGRHFLRSSALASALVRDAGVAARDLVVDVGAGTGALTRALALTGADVTALELDAVLAAQLRRRFASTPNVRVVEGDAACWSWPDGSFAVVANLPFARSGAILAHLLGDPGVPLSRADVIVQWEFAAKQAAVWPATLRATFWRAWYEVCVTGRLARTAFSPPPLVDAALLRVVRRPRPLVPAAEHDAYQRFLSAAFGSSEPLRRSLRGCLSPLQTKRLAARLGFSPDARAWDLDARQWSELFAFARGRDLPVDPYAERP